jgi:hypothetical protein
MLESQKPLGLEPSFDNTVPPHPDPSKLREHDLNLAPAKNPFPAPVAATAADPQARMIVSAYVPNI